MKDEIKRAKEKIAGAEAVVIGAGAGLSTAAGFVYDGAAFEKNFGDFGRRYGFQDAYSGGFYPYKTPEEEWGFWCRYIWVNRYMDPTGSVYSDLLELVRGRNYFVITTNVDHCFQKAGCDKQRLFYTQGDYGLWQCSLPCHRGTYDNEKTVRKMILAEGFGIGAKNELIPPQGRAPGMTVPGELAPRCPVCGRPMKMNLRSDDTFVEDAGWHRAAERYEEFMRLNGDRDIVYLEIDVG
ncbi:MAG: SIR2 family NAD-dependent protein deacylase [Anaerovoracaceae bacterium]|jgi:NAD-dependent SIR2 family protein deacetylase